MRLDVQRIEQAVTEYFAPKMAGFVLDSVMERDDEAGMRVLFHASEGSFDLSIMDDTLQQGDAATLLRCLEEANTAQVLRDLVEFPVMLTPNGCVF